MVLVVELSRRHRYLRPLEVRESWPVVLVVLVLVLVLVLVTLPGTRDRRF